VAKAGIDPLQHYEQFGWKEGRDPGPNFSTSHYLAVNPDVKLAGINPLDHYVLYGQAEHRPT
jgi:serralysin